jgi:uncharacterized lipoprotein YmbA
MSNTTRSLAMILLAASALAGCAGAPTRFYTLDAAPAAGPVQSDYAGPAIRVDAVHIPPALDRPELVRETAKNHLIVSDNDHWAAPLGEMVRRTLTQDLSARLPAGKVIFPDAPKPPGSAGVVIDILAISPSGGEVVMDVSWTVLSPSAKPEQASRPAADQHAARLTTPQAARGVAGDAAELSDLTSQLAQAIAASLK